MYIDFEPGDYVTNPAHKSWGIGQIQSIIGNKVTVNFENFGKRVINTEIVLLEKLINEKK
jgi:transcription elongation factor GreA-like protein